MSKTDDSIRHICIANIKRGTHTPFNYPLTQIFEKQMLKDIDNQVTEFFTQEDHELPIALTYIDKENWTLITTQKIVSRIQSQIRQMPAKSITTWMWNDFKGYKDQSITVGYLLADNQEKLDILIETGNASMILIYGISTLTRLTKSTPLQLEQIINRYVKHGLIYQSEPSENELPNHPENEF